MGGRKDEVVSEELLRILACPFCRKGIRLEGEDLVSECGLIYGVRDGIPHMIYPICPDCRTETEMIEENHGYKFVCRKCGKELHDTAPGMTK